MATETTTGKNATMGDDELVTGILAGDGQCFEILHARHRDRIFRYAMKRLSDAAEAEDVTQEVFLHVHRCLPSFQGRSTLLTWMFGIAHNQVCRRFRKPRPFTVSLDEPEAAAIATPNVPVERQLDASRILARCEAVLENEVSAPQREAFHLRYAENHSTLEIAKRLGKSNQAVKIGLFRSRRAIFQRTRDLGVAISA